MKKLVMSVALFSFAAGQASAQSFENKLAQEFQELSKNAGQIRLEADGLAAKIKMATVVTELREMRLKGAFQSAVAPVTPAKGFSGIFNCESRRPFRIDLNSDGTVTINGDQLLPDGTDHPYQGIQYNSIFVDENTFKMRSFGKFNGYDIESNIVLKISAGRKILSVSKNDKTSVNGRRIGVDESYECSRSFWNTW